jgi:crossover junction endodeoxyribonuclease RuvC
MASRVWIGIDPGLSGAVGVLGDTGEIWVYDTPTVALQRGAASKRREYAVGAMAQLLRQWRERGGYHYAALELVQARPGESSQSGLQTGRGGGIWEGILAALDIPYQRIHPSVWKKRIFAGTGLPTGDKGASRVLAQQLFPAAVPDLQRVKDDGRAEALLLAEWARRETG